MCLGKGFENLGKSLRVNSRKPQRSRILKTWDHFDIPGTFDPLDRDFFVGWDTPKIFVRSFRNCSIWKIKMNILKQAKIFLFIWFLQMIFFDFRNCNSQKRCSKVCFSSSRHKTFGDKFFEELFRAKTFPIRIFSHSFWKYLVLIFFHHINYCNKIFILSNNFL